jgi:hypothetical protein
MYQAQPLVKTIQISNMTYLCCIGALSWGRVYHVPGSAIGSNHPDLESFAHFHLRSRKFNSNLFYLLDNKQKRILQNITSVYKYYKI